ncbi:GFA family protein [Roseateles sp. DAIF2]|uniref:GFA family protein n=1 Tax=Roseateles sp. DAIF2 TaxID=2714952 RepID=UPI0018A311DF|nr:GFA family protein [Roseateles sp. DAIF2]QPF75004.1 GFA family protein [Roseateles sp. DAIF2]
MRITGQCHCGAIAFSAEDIDPTRVLVCHCADCQVLSGAPLRAVLAVPAAQVRLSGRLAPKEYVKVAASGRRRSQAFCPECGTQLYGSEPEGEAKQTLNFRLGCINERAQLRPTVQLWGSSAMPWLAELADIPLHAEGLSSPLLER